MDDPLTLMNLVNRLEYQEKEPDRSKLGFEKLRKVVKNIDYKKLINH